MFEIGGEKRMDGEFGIGRCKLPHLEWISNGVLLYNRGNWSSYCGVAETNPIPGLAQWVRDLALP